MEEHKSINDMKLFIRKYADDLNFENKKDILQLLKSKIDNNQIKEMSDGVRINLDILSDSVLINLYSLVNYKLKEESN